MRNYRIETLIIILILLLANKKNCFETINYVYIHTHTHTHTHMTTIYENYLLAKTYKI